MRLLKFSRRIRQQVNEAELLPSHHARESKLKPIRAELEAPPWDGRSGRETMQEIRDLHGPPSR
jgi:hypothetical protein